MKSSRIFLISLVLFTISSAENLSISQAYTLALENSKHIKSSGYQLEANKEQLTQIKTDFYPQLYLSGNYGKKQYGTSGFGNSRGYTLSLQQSIYNPETLNRLDIEKSRIQLSTTEFQLQKQELSNTVLQLYIEVLKSKNKIKLYDTYKASQADKLRLVERKYEMKLSNKMDLLQGKVDYHFSEIDILKEKKLLKLNRLRLKHLTGRSMVTLPEATFKPIEIYTLQRMKDTVAIEKERLSNLRIEQAQEAVHLSQQEITAASDGHLPTLSLSAQYSKIVADKSVSSLENTKSIMLQLQIPIYRGGKTESKIAASKLAYSAKQEELLQVQDDIKEEYEERWLLFNTAIHSLILYQEALKSANLYLDAIQQGLDNGLKSIIELNEAKTKLYEVKFKYNENIYEMISAYIQLLVLTNHLENLNIVDEIIR
jgi:outer membrane protein